MRAKLYQFVCGLALFLSAGVARADLAFSFTPAVQAGRGSNEVFFSCALTNTSLTDNLYLNDLQVSFTNAASNYLSADTNIFFANVPGILLPGENYQDVIIGVNISPAIPPGQYIGSLTILGGADIFAVTNFPSPAFQVCLSPASLSIQTSATNLQLSWPSPPGGFVLQQNTDLTTTNWQTMTNAAMVTNGLNQVMVSPDFGAQFFRLVYP